MIACPGGALADACATAFCNNVKSSELVHQVTEDALKNPEIRSVIIIAGKRLGLGGSIEIKVV